MQKNCKRCQKDFECQTENILSCDCNEINLSNESKEYLSKTTYDCLCLDCLKEIESYNDLKNTYPFPQHPSQYKEGVHYYIEGQYWVFTNFYHYLKGNCCKNNCRHCAYGYK